MANKTLKVICAAAGLGLTGMNLANAAVIFETSGTVAGNESHHYSFEIGSVGSYKATLSDFGFPEDFQVLKMKLSGPQSTLGQINGTGEIAFFASSPGTYSAMVFGNAVPGQYSFGSYGLSISPVPEPETWVMLLLGAGLVGYRLYQQRNQYYQFA